MPKLTIVNRAGAEKTIEAQAGLSVMENIRDAGFDELLALCGGCCSCATCHVHVDDAWTGAVGGPNGDDWEPLGIPDGSFVSDFEPGNETLWVAIGSTAEGTQKVWVTSDAGATWAG